MIDVILKLFNAIEQQNVAVSELELAVENVVACEKLDCFLQLLKLNLINTWKPKAYDQFIRTLLSWSGGGESIQLGTFKVLEELSACSSCEFANGATKECAKSWIADDFPLNQTSPEMNWRNEIDEVVKSLAMSSQPSVATLCLTGKKSIMTNIAKHGVAGTLKVLHLIWRQETTQLLYSNVFIPDIEPMPRPLQTIRSSQILEDLFDVIDWRCLKLLEGGDFDQTPAEVVVVVDTAIMAVAQLLDTYSMSDTLLLSIELTSLMYHSPPSCAPFLAMAWYVTMSSKLQDECGVSFDDEMVAMCIMDWLNTGTKLESTAQATMVVVQYLVFSTHKLKGPIDSQPNWIHKLIARLHTSSTDTLREFLMQLRVTCGHTDIDCMCH